MMICAGPLYLCVYCCGVSLQFSGSLRCTQLLLDHSAVVGAKSTRDHWTPLHRAVYRGHTGVAGLLLEYGADAGGVSLKGITALYIASYFNDLRSCCLLIRYGASVKAVLEAKYSPLALCRERGYDALHDYLEIVCELERGSAKAPGPVVGPCPCPVAPILAAAMTLGQAGVVRDRSRQIVVNDVEWTGILRPKPVCEVVVLSSLPLPPGGGPRPPLPPSSSLLSRPQHSTCPP